MGRTLMYFMNLVIPPPLVLLFFIFKRSNMVFEFVGFVLSDKMYTSSVCNLLRSCCSYFSDCCKLRASSAECW